MDTDKFFPLEQQVLNNISENIEQTTIENYFNKNWFPFCFVFFFVSKSKSRKLTCEGKRAYGYSAVLTITSGYFVIVKLPTFQVTY